MSLATPVAPRVLKTKSPVYPQFVFEYHETTGKAYLVELPGAWIDGDFVPDLTQTTAHAVCIAEHVDTHGRFLGFVQTFLRGYAKGAAAQAKE